MDKKFIIGAVAGFIVGTMYHLMISQDFFHLNLSTIQELILLWTVCIIFILLFCSLPDTTSTIVVIILSILIFIGINRFKDYVFWLKHKEIIEKIEKQRKSSF